MDRLRRALACAVVVCLPGCGLIRRNRVQPPVIAAPPTKPSKPIENPQVPPPPRVEQSATPAAPPMVVQEIPAKPPPPAAPPKPVKRPRRVKTSPPPFQAAVSAPAAETETAPDQPSVPVLAPVLSSGQQVAYNRAIDLAIDQAQSGLAEVRTKQMNQTQRANADRALSFVEQARQLRATDLVTAKGLADRAAVLAQALVGETR